MATSIEIVASYAMDAFYGEYKTDSQFFDLDDFIFHCGAALGEYYRQEFLQQYQLIRSEKKDEVVSFSGDVLNEQTLKVEQKGGESVATLDKKVMGFVYDKCTSGIQHVFSKGVELERTSMAEIWHLKSMPKVDRLFWLLQGDKIKLYSNMGCNASELKVYYIPAIGNDMEIPDSLVELVVTATVGKMRELQSGNVIKKSANQNNNKVLESEIDKNQLRQ